MLTKFLELLSRENPELVMLGGPDKPTNLNQWAIIGVGVRQQLTWQPRLFDSLQAALKNARQWPKEKQQHGLPFGGGLVAMFGYEFYHLCDPAFNTENFPEKINGWPTILAQECEDWLVLNLSTRQLIVLGENDAQYQTLWQKALQTASEKPATLADKAEITLYLKEWQTSFDATSFSKSVERIKTAITKGELYQANLSIRFQKHIEAPPLKIFETLCVSNPSPFSAYWQSNYGVLISSSPERLFNLRDAIVETRPIAGTRSPDKAEELLLDKKERAEHLMLVDLERNDLGRVCEAGSVVVNELLGLEHYSHVTHLVSNVQGKLRPDKTVWDTLKAVFPGGTITGCPKIRCIRILDSLEPVPRGFYTGSLGYIDAVNGDADFNILIRSLLLTRDSQNPLRYNAAIHAGAGIVADSIGEYEYRESLKKAHALLGALHACERQQIHH